MITNGSFQLGGPSPGSAVAWTLRSACAREAVAAFTPTDNAEGFDLWSPWEGALGNVVLAPFVPTATIETFDVWPNPLFALELTGGLVAATMADGFENGWGVTAYETAWRNVTATPGVFVGGTRREMFARWHAGAVYAFAFSPSALQPAPFAGGTPEAFVGWAAQNTTLG